MIAFVIVGDISVAKVPLNSFLCVHVFLNGGNVEKGVNTYVVDTVIVSWLMQAFLEEVVNVRA
jgi:hypothetical protein